MSLLLTSLLKPIESDVIGSILTVQSILMGFSFSVLFFLMSGNNRQSKDDEAIETKNKIRRLNKLSKELFFNVSYFNFLAIFSVLFSLVLLLPTVNMPLILSWLELVPYWDRLATLLSKNVVKGTIDFASFLDFLRSIFCTFRKLVHVFSYGRKSKFLFRETLGA